MRAESMIGLRVADRFTITRFLGEGGMATVFVATQDGEPREVALKVMNEELTADRSFVKRFQREAKAAAHVRHPNSVTFIDYGVADGISYIAMELLEGDDLYVVLERDGAVTQGRAVRLVIEVCEALAVAHDLGIVHRDLKPENIMVVPDASAPFGERVKVLDFGIAKLVAPETQAANHRIDPSSGVTRAGTFIGTPAYMSPEQCGLLTVDTRADIYTCGVLLFQLTTGRLPFQGETPLHTATLHIHEPAPRPSTVAPRIDSRLEKVILKALAKAPEDRQQTALELAGELRAILPALADVRVAPATAPPAGGAGSRGVRTRNSSAASLVTPPSESLESAKTMVAGDGEVHSPPSLGPATAARASPPSADPPTPQIHPPRPAPRPLAGAPYPASPRAASSTAIPTRTREVTQAPSSDNDDLMRTLVRAPVEEAVRIEQAFLQQGHGGPRLTEVIDASAIEAAAPRPPAPPPPAPRPSPKLTLKSLPDFKPAPSSSFKLGTTGAKLGGAPPSSRADEVAVAPSGPRSEGLGSSMRLGSAKLASKPVDEGEPSLAEGRPAKPAADRNPPPRETAPLDPPPPAPTPVDAKNPALAPTVAMPVVIDEPGEELSATQRIDPVELSAHARPDGQRPADAQPVAVAVVASGGALPPAPPQRSDAFGSAATVPVLSSDTARGLAAQLPPMSTFPEVPPSRLTVPLIGPTALASAPPPTPPIRPMDLPPPQVSSVNDARGLAIGFLAGAALMAVIVTAYFYFLR